MKGTSRSTSSTSPPGAHASSRTSTPATLVGSTSSTDVAAPLEPGIEIAGFRIERSIGRGRSAVVYEATQLELDRRVALKLFEFGSEAGTRLRTLRWPEHPNVVRMYAAGTSESGNFLALQLVRGSSLARLLDRGTPKRGLAQGVLADVAAALDAAHRTGYVHGAVNGKNVL